MHPRSKVGRSHKLMPKSDPKDLCPPAKYKPRRDARPLSAAEIKARPIGRKRARSSPLNIRRRSERRRSDHNARTTAKALSDGDAKLDRPGPTCPGRKEKALSNIVELRPGAVAVIIVDNPPVNALKQAVRAGLKDAFTRARDDASIHAIVLTAAGRTFMAGADITEFPNWSRCWT